MHRQFTDKESGVTNKQAKIFNFISYSVQFSQFSRSVVSDSLRPHELQHARPPCPSPTPGVGDGQGGLACCGSWGRKELDRPERLN